MCFSAQASFGASALLTIIGGATIEKIIRKKQYRKAMLAIVPTFFAIQQCFEGFVWLGLAQDTPPWHTPYAIFGFLFFAFFLWPVLIPYALIPFETSKMRKNMLYMAWGLGICVAAGLAWTAFNYGVRSEISCNHIAYTLEFPDSNDRWGTLCYILATVLPFFISSKRKVWLFGIALCGSIGLTWFMYNAYFTSVWCFFSALLSILLYFFI